MTAVVLVACWLIIAVLTVANWLLLRRNDELLDDLDTCEAHLGSLYNAVERAALPADTADAHRLLDAMESTRALLTGEPT